MISSSCSGSYIYFCNEEPAGVEEHWQITCTSSTRLIQARREAANLGLTIEVNSAESGGQFTQCIIQLTLDTELTQLRAKANYEFFDDGLKVSRELNDTEEIRRFPAGGYIFSPLMRIYNGDVIRRLEKEGAQQVLTPDIKNTKQQNDLLWPIFSQREASYLGDETLSFAGIQRACAKFEYSGGEYGPGTHFWLDEHDVMQRYCWEQADIGKWMVDLKDYQRTE